MTVTSKIKVVAKVSSPPSLSPLELTSIREESQQLHDAFMARTARMEILTIDDLSIRAK